MNFKLQLLIAQIYIHLAFLGGLVYLPFAFSIPIIIFCQIIFVGLCGTVFYHRVVAHKNPVRPWIEKTLLLLSWIGVSGSAVAWAGTHRKHHRFTDTDRDPHSPMHHGIIKSYWYSSGNEDIIRYVPDLIRNKWYVFQHKYYFQALFGLHLIAVFVLPLQIYWACLIVPGFLMWFAGSTINVFCHDKNGSKNLSLLGFLHGGEGWHKNHHEEPANPNFRHPADWGYKLYNIIRAQNGKVKT